MTDLRQTAEAAAHAGGDALRQHAGRITGLRTKSGTADMVSAADIAAGVAVVSTIAQALPEARFVIEEPEVYELAGVTPGTLGDDEVWVIDPLDGTTSFVHSYPCWSVSVACLRQGRPVAAAVYNVPANEMFSAAAGEGATLDGARLTCAGSPTLDRALLCTGFPYDRGEPFTRQLRLLEALVRPAHDVRRDGSAAVDLCSVAAGRVDGFWETALQPWDMAAGALIVEESGGLITDFAGNPWTVATRDIVAANLALHAVLLEAIRKADRR
ncbi:MAG: inositol monophosphatase family protein [Coriobacteriia bacterium]|nr:inositol monophosphatase family protein [Coriobacteriia bacterium]